MKIRTIKQENGNWTIIVRKTRAWENPTVSAENVSQDEYEDTLSRLVQAVAGREEEE